MLRTFLLLTILLGACGPRTTIRETSAGGGIEPRTSSGEAPAHVDADAPPPRAWLWRVSGGNAAAPSYVLGTMHVGIRTPDALPPPYDAYLDAARALVMEVDFREVQRFMTESAQAHHARAGRTLDRALGRESWARLVAEMSAQVPEDVLRNVPPGTMTLYLQQVRMAEVEATAEGREPIPGVPSSARLDATLFDEAIRHGTPLVALETPEQGLAALDALPAGDVIAELHAIVDHPDEARAHAASLRAAYLAFDEAGLSQLIAAEVPAAQREIVLTRRNRAWEAALFPQIQEGNAFIAVGVGHLLGPGSVLEALTAQGYTVERLGP